MKYLSIYKIFEKKDKKDKILEKILKFFDSELIAKKAIELHPKLAIWIINQFKQKFIKEFSDKKFDDKNQDSSKKDIEKFFAPGVKYTNVGLKVKLKPFWNSISSKFQSIIDWSKSYDITPEERKNITKLTFDEAYKKSEDWHNSLKAGGVITDEYGEVIMEFPDGFYWIDLETTYCRAEADAMGHCGNTDRGSTLYSLRDRDKSPHITVSIDTYDGIIYQMKGRNNKKPIEKYHKYIVDLLMNDDLDVKGFGAEYDKNNDFNPDDLDNELLIKLKEKRPDIDQPVHTDGDIENMFENMIQSYFIEDADGYGFRLVSWVYDLYDMKTVINCLDWTSKRLYNILCDEYPNKWVNSQHLSTKNIILDTASTYIDPDPIAKKYNVELKSKIPIDKWDELYKYIGIEGLENELKDKSVWDKCKNKIIDDDFIDVVGYGNNITKYNYDDIINYFLGTNKKEQFKELEKLFNYEYDKQRDNYFNDVPDVWDLYDCYYEINNKLSMKEKEQELENYDWFEYNLPLGYR